MTNTILKDGKMNITGIKGKGLMQYHVIKIHNVANIIARQDETNRVDVQRKKAKTQYQALWYITRRFI